jgi:hypothetical protein
MRCGMPTSLKKYVGGGCSNPFLGPTKKIYNNNKKKNLNSVVLRLFLFPHAAKTEGAALTGRPPAARPLADQLPRALLPTRNSSPRPSSL